MAWKKWNDPKPSKAKQAGGFLGGKAKSKLEARNMTPSSMVEAKAEWEVRYRAGRKFLESESAYGKRTGDKRPGGWLF